MSRHEHRRRPRRRGFTLVEMLVVIVIIGLLMALLIPAIAGAIRAARAAAVQAEINQLATALADFKNKYGDYFPSRVVLFENRSTSTGKGSAVVPSGGDPVAATTVDVTWTQLESRSLTAMRKFWPRVAFGAGWATGQPWFDFNGNGGTGPDSAYVLQGPECLTFFLGGVPTSNVNGYAMTGFGKDPTNPFTNSISGNAMYNANRNPPFYEFAPERLQLVTALQTSGVKYRFSGATAQFALSGIPGYIDSLGSQGEKQNFLCYFSTNCGAGYDPNDVNFESPSYDVGFNSSGTQVTPPTATIVTTSSTFISPSPNPYTNGTTFLNPQSFQIISPGSDGAYGFGGVYLPNSSTSLPLTQTTSPADPNVRIFEKDNLTNFHNGRLE